jgi:hypothetical protein
MKALSRRIGELEERHDRWLQAKQREREHAAYMRAVRHAKRLELPRLQRRKVAATRKAEVLRKAEAERQAELAAISAREAGKGRPPTWRGSSLQGMRERHAARRPRPSTFASAGWKSTAAGWLSTKEPVNDAATFEHDLHDDY